LPSSDQDGTSHNPDAEHFLAVAKAATATASDLVRSRPPRILTWKGDRDVTSDVDLAVETVIRDFLRKHTPIAGFLGEEAGGSKPIDGYHWILDPIDGTVNFLHGVPLCAISLSLALDGAPVTAVIDLPFLGTQYTALRGYGAYANGKKIRVSTTCKLTDALVSVDQYTFGTDSSHTNRLRHHLIGKLAPRIQRIRMLGTSAIDLAWTAHGRLDACVLLGNKPWDTSAGVLIAREAGAHVVDFDGTNHSTNSFATIAVTPSLEQDLMTVLRSSFTEVATSD
jgi:myo-inositol-1(or 4)-monophosphatase